MKINVFKTADEALENIADFFIKCGNEAIAKRDRFTVALSGGNSPKKLHALLVSSYKDKIDWNKIWFFFGDERDVPQTDERSNYLMAKNTLLDPLGIDPAHVFPVETALGAELAAEKYTSNLIDFFDGENACFDFILLGLGDNSHTASLFPHTSVLHDDTATVQALYIDEVKMNRITFTAPLINNAHHIVFMVYGEGKAEAVKHIIEDDKDIEEYPAQLIVEKPDGDLQWFLDESAASKLSSH
ncbi:6-phosphogluconolactonase [Mucilaginibacter segetis]|uniref:6-phosphogluconolactonase n=1 Tax=Mucilaginibacter segetis TaxID=2793071 RepID=A0A934UMW3_9SPHI|nr:6-phosphogluconolactonase [Mucilaginibacter segetis]MBK0379794.1 6-phosphogluconolactonase [Mucilaginibacter segetis]